MHFLKESPVLTFRGVRPESVTNVSCSKATGNHILTRYHAYRTVMVVELIDEAI